MIQASGPTSEDERVWPSEDELDYRGGRATSTFGHSGLYRDLEWKNLWGIEEGACAKKAPETQISVQFFLSAKVQQVLVGRCKVSAFVPKRMSRGGLYFVSFKRALDTDVWN